MKSSNLKIAIVGAGINGLGIGWALAECGVSVDIFERGKAGRATSWAAAGMLAAASEAEPLEDAVMALHLHSQSLWPSFAARLEQASGQGIDYRNEGTLIIASERDEVDRLRFRYDYARSVGLDVEWLSGSAVREKEPGLGPSTRAAISIPQDHQVDNRKIVQALHRAALTAGATLHEDSDAALDYSSGRVVGVIAGKDRIPADLVILANGPWAGAINLPPLVLPPVRPIKGQAFALQAQPDYLRHVLWARGVYIVPRLDGRLIVGATVEEKGFDENLTAGGMLSLLHSAWHALPDIQELPLLESWVGFRPGSPDDAPIFGESGVPGLVYACGHNRNGFLLLPATIDATVSCVLRDKLPDFAKNFTMERFARSQALGVSSVAIPA